MSDADHVIHTERLTLTPPVFADFDDSATLWGDPETVRYIGGVLSTRADSWTRLQRQAGSWMLLGFGPWTIRERGTGRFVGEAGFANYKRDIQPSFGDDPEAGWVLASWAHGRGYATEAVRAAHVWGEARFAGVRTVCMIDVENAASLNVARKLGYIEFGRTKLRDDPVVLFERPLPARSAARSV